ncbi:enoyl-CoA hydratase/isomerase family protein [Allosalinactinospora lopnorensis]|uniref:enoyl-CoA hydratase/isomerase family protein n=1 Tax=Allosalinactinospora lopnorensis TaxID=1352348 RepID=UPI000623FF4E|nr:enoyl-CoA hydratase-related protein [Allosalinactinospora lopnorensis]
MTKPRGVGFDVDGAVGRIVLERSEASNSLDLPAAEAFGRAVTAAEDTAVRVVTLTGEGSRFCAGGDVSSFAEASDRPSYVLELASVLEHHLQRLSNLAKPVVAGVHGAVAGAGLAFLLNSDLTVAGRSTKFLMAYAGVGLSPDCGVSYLLPRAVGQQRALELALTGRVLTAGESREWGLVTEVVDDDQVAVQTMRIAEQLAAGPVLALGEAKRLVRRSWSVSRAASGRDEAETIARMVDTDAAQALIERFLSR